MRSLTVSIGIFKVPSKEKLKMPDNEKQMVDMKCNYFSPLLLFLEEFCDTATADS